MKKTLATFLSFAMLLSITACKAKTETPDTPDSKEITAETEITTVTEETTTPETTTTPPPPEPEREIEFGTLGAPTIREFDGIKTTRIIYFDQYGRYTGYEIVIQNENGDTTNGESYNSDGTLNYSYECEYKEDKRMKDVFTKPDGTILQIQECEYDADGNCTKLTWYIDGVVGGYRTYEYDEKGNEIKEVDYYADDSLNWYSVKEYDEKGNAVKNTNYNADGSLKWYGTDEFDKENRLVKHSEYDSYGLLGYDTYQYDENGDMIKDEFYNYMGQLMLYMNTIITMNL